MPQTKNPPGAHNATVAARRELLESLLRQEGFQATNHIPPRPSQSDFPLSFAQERIWFLQQIAPHSTAYNMPIAVRLDGEVLVRQLELSCQAVTHRHEALRARFLEVEGTVHQWIAPPGHSYDWSPLQPYPNSHDSALRMAIAEHSQCPFDLAAGPPIRFALLKLKQGSHVLLVNLHHIVADGSSLQIIVRELAESYCAFAAGRATEAPPIPIQYADYAYWQREKAQEQKMESAKIFWAQKLLDAPRSLNLPAVKSNAGARPDHAAVYNLPTPARDRAQVKRVLQKESGNSIHVIAVSICNSATQVHIPDGFCYWHQRLKPGAARTRESRRPVHGEYSPSH